MNKIRPALLVALVFILSSCAIPGTNIGGGSKSARPPDLAGDYIGAQEREFQAKLSAVDGAAVQRSQNGLTVIICSYVLFESDTGGLKRPPCPEIDAVADILKRYPETRIKVDGFSDNMGTDQQNHERAEARAVAVRDALAARGVDPNRMVARGFGESKPLTSNATEEGRRLNRRVTITIIPPQS